MKKSILIIAFLFTICGLSVAQFGISAKYQSNNTSDWDDAYEGIMDIEGTSIEYGLNYWFRLKNQRVEFLPEVTYASLTNNFNNSGTSIEISQHKRTSIGVGVNTHIYPLDFAGDCDCPTFSKDGNLVSKGFHWIVNTAIINHNVENTFANPVLSQPSIFDESTITALSLIHI